LAAWLSQLLPDPALVVCAVHYHDGTGDHVQQVSLQELDVGPLDCVAMADAAEVPQKSELEYRILYEATLPAGADTVSIDFAPAAVPPGSITFPDFFYLVKCLRALLGSGRALAPQDLTVPEKKAADQGGAIDLVNLRARATAIVTSLTNDIATLQTAIAGLPGATGPVRDALMTCSFYGVSGSVPFSSSDPDPGLPDQAASVLKLLQDRSTKVASIPIATAAVADLAGIFTTLLGGGFVVLPRFTPPDITNLQAAFGKSAALVASDPVAPLRWMMQLTEVRPALARLDTALSLAQLLGAGAAASSDLLLGQLPPVAGDQWLGLPLDPANPPPKGRLALACITQGNPITATSYAGLVVDEWPERIPSTKENAAVAFHYEEPKARAPQALLLAVCPDSRQTWDDDLILGILQEARELTQIRTVDLDSIQQVGQILPALYFALNMKGATPSTRFAIEKETIRAVPIGRP
jgi:hypothetical protein